MIKIHLLEKIMQVVTNVSKWVAGVKNKKNEKLKDEKSKDEQGKHEKRNKEMNKDEKKTSKKHRLFNRLFKVNKEVDKSKVGDTLHIQKTKAQPLSRSKVMKRWISFIKEENIIYLPSYSTGKQQQKLYSGDNVVYIDFDNIRYSKLKSYYRLKEEYNKEKYGLEAHSRAPTHYLYKSIP